MHTNMREDVLSFMFLALVGLLLASCLPASQAEEPPTMMPRPTQVLSGSVQAGELEELTEVKEQLRDVPISEFQVNGDIGLAITEENGQTNLLAINLRSGEVTGLNTSLRIRDNWLIERQYFAYTQNHPIGDWYIKKLHVYNLITNEQIEIGGENRWLHTPSVFEQTVVWSERRSDDTHNTDIYAYDITRGQTVPVVERSGYQMRPKVYAEWVIYMEKISDDPRNPMRDLYLHNLVTGEDMLIGPSPYAADLEGDTYGIDNGRVVWKGWAIGKQPTSEGPLPTLHVYDLETRTESVLDLSPVCTSVPVSFKMAGDLILFSCEGFYGCYDLAQEIFVRVPHPEHWSGYTYLSETYVVFRVSEKEESIWDYMTPGASPMPPEEHWLTPQPRQYRLLVVPITR